MEKRDFKFEPTFSKFEELLHVYKKLDELQKSVILKINISINDYRNKEKNQFPTFEIWLGFDYAMRYFEIDYRLNHSLVEVKIEYV
jgi:hypothetical protein